MPQTLAQKIIARAAGRATVATGEIVTCGVDLAMFHDSSGPRRVAPRLDALGAKVWDPAKVVVVTDHFVPATDVTSANILKLTRDWVRDNRIGTFYDMQGICHVVIAEHGHLTPGMFAAGGDSHSTTGGAFACYMAGYGATEMTGIMVTGEIWVKVPETIRVTWSGRFGTGVCAKDVMLFLCRELGMDNSFRVVEYDGDTVAAMDISERMVLTNMAAELGAETGIIAADATTLAALTAAGVTPAADALDWRGDPDATYCTHHDFDAAALTPMVAAPHNPANTRPAEDYTDVAVDQCYIGACTGAKYSDLKMAATVLEGRQVAASTRLLVAPASTLATQRAAADGTLAALTDAGAIIMPTGCGACPGMGAGVLADGETCISSTNRNFQGRMGAASAQVYLASPYSVAAAAITGRVCDPREFL